MRELFTGKAIVFCALPIQEISICRLFKIVEITVWNSIHHVQIVLTLGIGVDKLNFFLLLFSIFRFSTKNISAILISPLLLERVLVPQACGTLCDPHGM